MNERLIYLLEKYLDESVTLEEAREFELALATNPGIKEEFEEQKKTKEVLRRMKLKNPSVEVWDSYWLGIYNKVERGFAWIAISIGVIIILAFLSFAAAEHLFNDESIPYILKLGIILLAIGLIILVVSVLREKLFTRKYDKYKEIQR